jgi:hypothetical protein
MEQPRDASGEQAGQARAGLAHLVQGDPPTLAVPGTRRPEAWFLGPKGENGDMFERMVALAIRDHVFWRRNYHPADPTHITEAIKRSDEYLQAMDALQEGLDELLARISHRGVDFRVAEREMTGEHKKKVAVVV